MHRSPARPHRLGRAWSGRAIRSALAVLALVLVSAPAPAADAPPAPKPAATTGRVTGRVLNKDGQPVEWASVRIPALKAGTATDENGRYVLERVPAGTWTIVAGDGLTIPVTSREVPVLAGSTAIADFRATSDAVHTLQTIDVTSERKVDPGRVSTETRIGANKLAEMKAENLTEAVAKVMGVVASADGIHVRGGRANEVKTVVNGVPSNDALTERSPDVAVLAVSSLNVTTGGMDAEIGDALSGVIAVETREGSDRFGGEVRWDADRFGDLTKTFDHYDRVTFGFGGPTPVKNLTYFTTYEGAFSDGYLASSLTKPSTTLFDFVRFGNRQNNRVNGSFKAAWKPSTEHKLTFEVLKSRSISTPYDHAWSRSGFVQVAYDTSEGTNGAPPVVTPIYGNWSATPLDSTYQFMNLPDHVPTQEDRYQQFNLAYQRQPSSTTSWTLRLSQFGFSTLQSVGRKEPWEYDTQAPFYWSGNTEPGTENNPYFATHGDLPAFVRSRSSTWFLKSDVQTTSWKAHNAKAGFEVKYNELDNLSLLGPNNETNGLPGATRSSYHYFNPEAAVYVRDRWSFEGMILNAGVRWEMFSPGAQITDADLPSGRRYKAQWSPRLGIAFPVSDRDALSFYYGWVSQTPARSQIFENRGALAAVAIRGNPDLEPQTTVSYQAGLQHVFSRDLSGQFAVFFKDIFGLIATRTQSDEAGNLLPVFVNNDYASSRGFEASLTKAFSHHFSSDFNYTYSLSNGLASDPTSALQFINGGRLYLPISELPLAWDQRHTLNANLLLRVEGRYGVRVAWEYGSGLPFTPAYRNERRQDPAATNSRRQPSRTVLNVDGDKYYRVWGRPVTLFFDVRNLLDARNLSVISPGGVANPNVNLAGDDYTIYFTETGRAGGAYLQDTNGDGTLDWVALHDPRVFEEGRRVRLGFSTSF